MNDNPPFVSKRDLEEAFLGALSEFFLKSAPVRVVNIPGVQKVAGDVSVERMPELLAMLKRAVLAIHEIEMPAMPEVQKVEITNHPEAEKRPEVQKVELTTPFPKEMKASVSSLPKEAMDLLRSMLEELKRDVATPEVSVGAPDMAPIAGELALYRQALDEFASDMLAALSRDEDRKDSKKMLGALKRLEEVILGIVFPSPDKMPKDASGNLATVRVNALVTKPFDNIAAAYPTATREVYSYSLASVVHTTVTVDYTDSTKNYVSNVAKA